MLALATTTLCFSLDRPKGDKTDRNNNLPQRCFYYKISLGHTDSIQSQVPIVIPELLLDENGSQPVPYAVSSPASLLP